MSQASLVQHFDANELPLVIEALVRMRATKQDAYDAITKSDVPGGDRFRPADFAIPQLTALLSRLGETPEVELDDATGGPRIIGTFIKQAWGNQAIIGHGIGGNDVINLGQEPFDATRHVLEMALDEIQALVDQSRATDQVGLAHVQHSGPHDVLLTSAICEFFGTADLSSITEDMLRSKREDHDIESALAVRCP